VDDRAVAARGLAEAAAVVARGQRAELAVHERDDLLDDVVGVVADRRGVDVLVSAERGEAIGEDDDRRAHAAFVEEARGALRTFSVKLRHETCARPEPMKPTRS
jgi:hypothetical protein